MAITVRSALTEDIDVILAITNQAIAHTDALWIERPLTRAERQEWMNGRIRQGFPVLVACKNDGSVVGFGSYGPFRSYEGYNRTVELSLYVADAERGKGIGSAILTTLIQQARTQEKHVMVAAITHGNAASEALHRRFGFETAGVLREVGVKRGRWLDLLLMTLRL